MNRRSFFRNAVFSAASLTTYLRVRALNLFGAGKPHSNWGYIDVDYSVALRRRGIWLRVIFNGKDVTDRCFKADDRTGCVGLLKHSYGHAYIDDVTGDVAREFLQGDVYFKRVEPWRTHA